MTREDPNWPRASAWLRDGHKMAGGASLAVMGVPLSCSLMPGNCDLAPAAVRQALAHFSLYDTDARMDVANLRVKDFGDVSLSGKSAEGNFFRCVESIKRTQAEVGRTVLLGGDNAITRPGFHAMGFPLEACGLITFDAHHDLRDLQHGLMSNNPVRALLRDGLPGANIIQIGIQPFVNSAVYARVAREAGITVVTADEIFAHGMDAVVGQALDTLAAKTEAIYVSMDMDVMDRAFAPACPGSRPGGLHPSMLRRAATFCGQEKRVRMIDLVEMDPTTDVANATAMAAASFLLAFASGVATRPTP